MLNFETTERHLARRLGRRHAFLVGRGTTAIWLALKTLEPGEIILPTVACPTLAETVLAAGFTPVFADISRTDFTLDPASVAERITPRTRAILAVHLFGNAAPLAALRAFGLPILEDAAQSLGGRIDDGRPMGGVGDFGDFGILSFGPTKILDAGGGGALVTDDDGVAAEIERLRAALPGVPAHRTIREHSHRNLVFALTDLLRADPTRDVHAPFRAALPLYADLYAHRLCDEAIPGRIDAAFAILESQNRERTDRACAYFVALDGCDGLIRTDAFRKSGVVWRYTVLVNDPGRTAAATDALRAAGIHASNHYWSVADLLGDAEAAFPNTAYVCPRLLNLWVDGSVEIDRTAAVLRKALQ